MKSIVVLIVLSYITVTTLFLIHEAVAFQSHIFTKFSKSSGVDDHVRWQFSSTRLLSQQESLDKNFRSGITDYGKPVNGENSQLNLTEVNVLYGRRTSLVYDIEQERFVNSNQKKGGINDNTQLQKNQFKNLYSPIHNIIFQSILPRLKVSFIPSGVTSNYYSFVRWRIVQRFVNANLHVFGTQSLLLGLGIKANMSSKLGALSAALNWVLKDALGKIVRMMWASKMGLRFDSDAKRWRFRSAFVFAAGNGLEIATYIFPHMFLLWATLANCCKQISTLTSSSTRSSIFNSFRDGTRENIADITAKGEAQIAIVDLFGIASGVTISRIVGMSVKNILLIYFILQALEIFCVYSQLRHVEYRVLNFERLINVINTFLDSSKGESLGRNKDYLPTPHEIARKEMMFMPPAHLSRRRVLFGSLGRAKLSKIELEQLLKMFERERYLIVVGKNLKPPHIQFNRYFWKQSSAESIQEKCHIVLHSEATNTDIVKSTLALLILRKKLSSNVDTFADVEHVRTSDCINIINDCINETDKLFGPLLRQMGKQGWESPARLMFARVNMRAEWPRSVP